jgi:hypothetical protein
VTTVFAAVVNERRLSGLTHNQRPLTPALRADGRRLVVVVRVLVRHSASPCHSSPTLQAPDERDGYESDDAGSDAISKSKWLVVLLRCHDDGRKALVLFNCITAASVLEWERQLCDKSAIFRS